MAYCVMNVDKQSRSAVYGLQIEANRQANDGREFDNSDIDPTLTKDNIYLRRCDHWNAEITRQIHDAELKERKNSVVMITGVYTASPEWFEEHTEKEWLDYFNACLKFHDETYGRCFNAVIHLDEKTPHMQVASVPIIEDEKGKHLSAKIIMGNRHDYQIRQDQFAEKVGRQFGLERGERRDPTERKAHTTKRDWQIATQEAALERAKQETKLEHEKTQEILARRQASIEQADRQKLEALRERDAARTDRDITKALAGLQNAVMSSQSVDIEIISEREARRSLTGKETPATVTIAREDFDRLQHQASVNSRTIQAANDITKAYKGIRKAAEIANENRIDKQAAANAAAVSKQGRLADQLTQELERVKKSFSVALQKAEQKIADLSEQLTEAIERVRSYDAIISFFPDTWNEMKERTKKARKMERSYDDRYRDSFGRSYVPFEGHDVDIRSFLLEYMAECDRQNLSPASEMKEHLKKLLSYDRNHELER